MANEKSKRPKGAADLWAEVDRERKTALGLGEAPEGGLTLEDYRKRYGLTGTQARRQIGRLVECGALVPAGRVGPMRRKVYTLSQ